MSEKIVSIDLGKLHIFFTLRENDFFIENFVPSIKFRKFKPYHPDIALARLTMYWQWFEINWYFRSSWMWGIKTFNL